MSDPEPMMPPPERPSLLRNLWYASIGLASFAGEQTGRIAGALVRKGREAEPVFRERSRKAAEEIDRSLAELREQMRGMAERIGRAFPNRAEVDSLRREVEELKARIEELSRQAGSPPPSA